jgi:hypothetical protein
MAINTETTGFGLQLTNVQLRPITAEEEAEWNHLMDDCHPLGNVQFAGGFIKYVAEDRGRAVALVCISGSAYHLADRDRWIGWTGEQIIRRRHFIVQNSRFLILAEGRNLASRVLSLCARRVASDWELRFGFAPLLMETFVDPVHFRGTCYKAAGWQMVGTTRGFSRDGREFYTEDSYPKQIWLKPLCCDAADILSSEQLPDHLLPFEKDLPRKQVASRLGFKGLRSLFMVLQSLPDPRRTNGRRYPLGCCLSLVAAAVMAGCEGLRECAEFAGNLTQTQLEALRSWKNPKTGRYEAPNHVTLWRIVSSVDADEFERVVNQWFRDEGLDPEAIALDGKALRATAQNEDGGSYAVSAASHPGTPLFSISSSLTPRAPN